VSSAPRVGIFPSSTDRSMPIVDLARAAEARGFTSIFLNEHTHLPVAHPRSQWPGGEGATPDTYARFWDPFVALAFVAAHTSLEIGTAVSLVAEHDPIALAKAIATLDHLADGRVTVGAGWGWNREEFEGHGRGPANTRAAVALEHLDAMRALWRDDVASFDGASVHFGPCWSYPKPRQRPGPPVLLGAPTSERNLDRIVRHADGWIPMGPTALFDDALPGTLDALRTRWRDAGRAGEPVITVVQAANRRERLDAAVERAQGLAIERVIVHVGEMPETDTVALLDRLAPAIPPPDPPRPLPEDLRT
jgi:probable F420-dependent oxidoreductase